MLVRSNTSGFALSRPRRRRGFFTASIASVKRRAQRARLTTPRVGQRPRKVFVRSLYTLKISDAGNYARTVHVGSLTGVAIFFFSSPSCFSCPAKAPLLPRRRGVGDAYKARNPAACKKNRAAAAKEKKTHSYTGRSPPPPQGQGSGRRSVADNARFGAQ